MRLHARITVAALTAALLAPTPVAVTGTPPEIKLTAGEVALIMGGSGVPTPTQQYADSAATLYLAPHGFNGTPEVLTTPELFTPGNDRQESEDPGADILTHAVQQKIADGAAGPVYVFGYSQSSALSGLTMHQLAAAGVPSDDVHFVLVGDPGAPNGGLYSTFGLSSGANPHDMTPSDLYPADVYSLEYDPVGDWPRYSADLLSDLNAAFGTFFEHLAYLGLSPEQIADAIPLPTTGDSLVNYYVIPSETLPLLAPLLLFPVVGKPLYDLVEPATRILVNLGYGSITDGWNPGPADVASTVNWGSPDLDMAKVLAALGSAVEQGVAAFTADLADPATYQVGKLLDSPALTQLIAAEYAAGLIETPHPESTQTALDAFWHLDAPATY